MICLNNTDTLEGGASVNAVVDYTVHGLVGTAFTNIAQGRLSNTNPTVLYTASSAVSIVSIILVNTHNVAVTVDLYLDHANGGSPRRLIPEALSLGAGYSLHFDGQRATVMDTNGQVLQTYPGVVLLSNFTAKGSLIVGTGANTAGELQVGADNKLIRADSGQATGLEYVTVQGTSNQVTVTHNAGDITLSAPQDIHTGASPTFVTAKLTGLTDNYIPYHVADGTGLANSLIYTTSAGLVCINDTSNANMTQGLTINQGANDDEIVAFKSSDVTQPMTDYAEADTYAAFQKVTAGGGLWITGLGTYTGGYDLALRALSGGAVDTTKTAAGIAPLVIDCAETNGGTSIQAVSANGNLFAVRNNGSGKFLVDAEGDLFADGGTSSTNMVTQYDGEDDAQLVRALAVARDAIGAKGLIRTKFDQFLKYKRHDLERAGIIGKVSRRDYARGVRPLINVTRLQQLHNGAIWQGRLVDAALAEAMSKLNPKFKRKFQEVLKRMSLNVDLLGGAV